MTVIDRTHFDYPPYGSPLIGREYSSDTLMKYRFGFNGKENDNETKGEGNQQDYGMRIYDTRLGKFLSVDPLMKEYPFNSTYAFAENTPIYCIDRDGLEKSPAHYFMDLTKAKLIKASSSILSPFVTVGSLSIPLINQAHVVLVEGAHEGEAYHESSYLFKNTTYKLENWKFVPLGDDQEAKKEMLKASIEVVSKPIKVVGNGASLMDKVTKKALKKVIVESIKKGIDQINPGNNSNSESSNSSNPSVIVTGDGVRLRSESNTESSVLGLMYKNATLTPSGKTENGFSEVSTNDGRKGWISNQFISQPAKKDKG
ncbi:MAG: SH3 domain-containing protein [Flavobacteriales bacterium]|nr:SH3 domain-containing protein [Flavobacteriales bacterium]